MKARVRISHAQLDSQLTARIVSRRTLTYTNEASPDLDRPLFVRAASGICWFGDWLAIIQDDVSFIALVDPKGTRVEAAALMAGPDGLRQFDVSRGNKRDKLDLECCFTTEVAGVRTFLAFGSGSKKRREQIVRVRDTAGEHEVHGIQARAFYAALNDCKEFSGSELNLEGAVLCAGKIVLWQRGNGDPHKSLSPINATCQIDFADFVRYLDDPDAHEPPALEHITQYELGSIAGVGLTFTDATIAQHGDILFLASAEASPNVIDDGVVVGAALGVLRADGAVLLSHLLDESGQLCRDKVEGIVLDQEHPGRAWAVMDPDDHTQPACLLELRLEGPWT